MADGGPVVTNSGPLIAMATIGQIDLVGQLYGSVFVPEAVFREVSWYGANRPGAAELATAPWAVRVALDNPPDPLLAEDLGPGEAAAITLAVRRNACLLLLDDRRARRVAEIAYHLRVKGVTGMLVAAKRRGLLASIRPLIEEMRGNGYYLAQPVIDRALREAGEG
ncbi:MAG: DUF3368 domain-containing protein [Beggiatoa sp.]|nr:DUF3368 domain-containing protein [Beggiatoa sp.]